MGEFTGTGFGSVTGADGSGQSPALPLIEALGPLDERKTRLLMAFSHGLRSPLTSALGFLELLGDESLGPLTAEQRRALETVAGSVQRLCGYIDEFDPGALRKAADQRLP